MAPSLSDGASDRRLHVLFLTFHCPRPEEPGAVRPWAEACQLRDLGCSVTVITSAIHYMTGQDLRKDGRGWCSESEQDGIRFLRVSGLVDYRKSLGRRLIHYTRFAALSFLAALIRMKQRPDVVLVGTDPVLVSPVAWAVAGRFRARLVLDERDLYPETALALGVLKPGLLSRGLSAFQRALRRRAAFILCATPGIQRALQAQGVPDEKLGLLYNADAALLLDPGSSPTHTSHRHLPESPWGDARFRIIYAGSMGRASDLDTLLDAAVKIGHDTGIVFLLVGGGERAAGYRARAERERLPVRFTGPLTRQEARSLIREADLGLLLFPEAPLFQTALPSKLFDYLGLGCPVVFLGSGDSETVLRESSGGIRLPSGDAATLARLLLELEAQPERCRTMGRAGRVWFERCVGGGGVVGYSGEPWPWRMPDERSVPALFPTRDRRRGDPGRNRGTPKRMAHARPPGPGV